MIGAELVNKDGTPAIEIIKKIIVEVASQGVVLTKCGASTIRFAPPLIINKDQLDKGLSTIIMILKKYQW